VAAAHSDRPEPTGFPQSLEGDRRDSQVGRRLSGTEQPRQAMKGLGHSGRLAMWRALALVRSFPPEEKAKLMRVVSTGNFAAL
jgi:hypothetical protein